MSLKKFQLSNVITVSFAHLVHDTFSSFLAPLLPLLREKLGITYALAGLLSAIQKAPSLFNPFVGLAADKINLRFLVILSPLMTAILMSLLGPAPNISSLFIILFLTGVSSTLFHVPSPVIIKEVSGSRIGLGMSFYMLGGEFARTIGPLLVLGAVSLWGLEGTWKLIPIGFLASLLLYFRFKNIEPIRLVKTKKEKPHHLLKKLKIILLFILFFSIFREIIKTALTLFLPSYIIAKGGSIWFGGISLALLQFAGAMGTTLSGLLSDKLGRIKILRIISFGLPTAMVLFTFSNNWMMFPALIALGFVAFASNPVLLAFIQDINSDYPAFLNSIYMTLQFFISFLVTLGIGFLADRYGLEMTYKVCAFGGLGLVPISIYFTKTDFL
ncbi:MAG: MFS transporter [Candidatus Marinimicrobia bacterium]|nr:MFS transporter [Candidatus Neomarinimicrobiota bacterium]